MAYAHSTIAIVNALEDALDALPVDIRLTAAERARVDAAYEILNACHGETDMILKVVSRLDGDGTYTPDGWRAHRSYGYQVGGVVDTLVNPSHEELLAWVEAARRYKGHGGTPVYLGVWTDENGDVHYDLSVWVEDYDAANALGVENDEIAIWDWANSTAKNVLYTADQR